MANSIDWNRVARADWIDKKARLLFVEREHPKASPYFNLMAEMVKPTVDDYAAATEFVDRHGHPSPHPTPTVHPEFVYSPLGF